VFIAAAQRGSHAGARAPLKVCAAAPPSSPVCGVFWQKTSHECLHGRTRSPPLYFRALRCVTPASAELPTNTPLQVAPGFIAAAPRRSRARARAPLKVCADATPLTCQCVLFFGKKGRKRSQMPSRAHAFPAPIFPRVALCHPRERGTPE